MALTGRLAEFLLGRLERLPSVQETAERQKRIHPVLHAALAAAYSSQDDEEAKATLARKIDADEVSIDGALTALAKRKEYIGERAWRLLTAVRDDVRVAPTPHELTDLFAQEEALGRMSIDEAFHRLASMAPGLLEVERQLVSVQSGARSRSSGLPRTVDKALVDLLGRGALDDSELLHTDLARSIVQQYLEIANGTTALGSVDTPYFDARVKIRRSTP